MYYTQSDVDAAFRDYEQSCRVVDPVHTERNACTACGSTHLRYNSRGSSDAGTRVCLDCGAVQTGMVLFETMYGRDLPTHCSNYKRIHHWHERVSQFLLHESPIPADEMLVIGERLLSGEFTLINKDVIRGVLRSLGMQTYIEKWLQIVDFCTGVRPPIPGPVVLSRIDEMFTEMQQPFKNHKPDSRRNFINYNYVFCRFFQMLDCEKFCMFFPLIKSKSKLAVLDSMWSKIAVDLRWDDRPLSPVAPFAVQLETCGTLLQHLRERVALRRTAGCSSTQHRTVCRTSGPSQPTSLVRVPRWQHHSERPAMRGGSLAARLRLKRSREEREVRSESPPRLRMQR